MSTEIVVDRVRVIHDDESESEILYERALEIMENKNYNNIQKLQYTINDTEYVVLVCDGDEEIMKKYNITGDKYIAHLNWTKYTELLFKEIERRAELEDDNVGLNFHNEFFVNNMDLFVYKVESF